MTAVTGVWIDRQSRGQLLSFAGIGLANTVLYFAVYDLLRVGLPPHTANAAAVAVSVASSFWLNRRFTFGFTGHQGLSRQLVLFAGVFLITLTVSSAALKLALSVLVEPSLLVEHVALVGSTATVTLARFCLLRSWVFQPVDRVKHPEPNGPTPLGETT